ncbi:MAG: HAMP domain-containing sensor histidine kinase [Anaerolineaceae bacterium]|nr:HAMP domain-containing sensor histidine kinase [Anaerolineaceae bacterium]
MFTAIVTEPETGQFRNLEVSPQWLQTGLTPSLLAEFSYEIHTQLTSIQYISDHLRKRTPENDPQSRSLNLLAQNVDTPERLVDDLLFTSEWEASNHSLQRETLTLDRFLWRVIHQARDFLDEAKVALSLNFAGISERTCWADSKIMSWSLVHLIRNAALYGKSTKQIQLLVQRVKKNLEFIVADDGQGIHNEDLPHIFERFYRGKSSRSGKEGAAVRGLGQGLHFARAIAEAHGGSLEVESQPTQGATLILRIPFIETFDQ